MEIKVKNKLLSFDNPMVMGIVNLTPDSFFCQSRLKATDKSYEIISKMFENGADIIDIGAMSTRPGAKIVDEKEEWDRYQPVLEIILKKFPERLFSIDTFRSSIAKKAVKNYGISIINDITAGEFDPDMFEVVAECKVPYVIMHMVGLPENMQDNVSYESFMRDIILYFSAKVEKLKQLGVSDIIIDPGFGFSKTVEQNFILLNNLESLGIFELPVLAGLSRKTMIWKLLGISPDEALNGTTVLNTIALGKGVNILRVHDVVEASQAVKLFTKTKLSKEEYWLA